MSAVEDSLETQARIGALRCEGGPHSPTGHLLRQLADEIERLRAELDPTKNALFQAQEAAKALLAERDALRVDAERYRWLRNSRRKFTSLADGPYKILVWRTWNSSNASDSLYDERLDAAIDAALGKGGDNDAA